MPAPITIRDPATYYEPQNHPSDELGEDMMVPIHEFLSTMNKSEDAQRLRSSGDDESSNSRSIQRKNKRHMEDISMSPRLMGYLCSLISSAVSTISSTVFLFSGATEATKDTIAEYFESINVPVSYEKMEKAQERIEDMNDKFNLYFGSGGNLVYEYKVFGSIAVSGLLTVITAGIVMAHFDSIICVKKNRKNFQDGSKFERNLLLLLISLTVCALYISTSKFSVGEAQANVFFSTWTNFVSCVANYEVWRKGSGRNHSFQNVLFGQKRHWFLLSIFTTTSFLSTIDFFLNNNIVKDTHDLGCIDLSWSNKWIWYSLAGCVISWVVMWFHRYCEKVLAVTILEAIVSLGIMGAYGYILHEFAGGRLDQIHCPSNLYFSVWAAFFLAVWIFSTVIQSNRIGILESRFE